MTRQRVTRGMVAALSLPALVLLPVLANAEYHEINIGGIGYVYEDVYAGMILKDSPFRTPGATQYYVNKEADYPNTGTDASIEIGAASTVALIRNICSADPDCRVSLFTGSNGSNVGSEVNDDLIEINDPLLERIKMFLAVNPRDPYGGIATSFPTGTVVPSTGITAGYPTQSGGAYVMSFRNQYDLISDYPDNPLNLLAVFNATLGFTTVHPLVNPNVLDPRNVITVSEDGTFISVLVYTEVLPILQVFVPFLPKPIIQILDAVLRPIIELGYNRPGPSGPTMQELIDAQTIEPEPQGLEVAPQQRVASVQQIEESDVTDDQQPSSTGAYETAISVPSTVKTVEGNDQASEPTVSKTGDKDQVEAESVVHIESDSDVNDTKNATNDDPEEEPKEKDKDDDSDEKSSQSSSVSSDSSSSTATKTDSDKNESKSNSSEGSSSSGSDSGE